MFINTSKTCLPVTRAVHGIIASAPVQTKFIIIITGNFFIGKKCKIFS